MDSSTEDEFSDEEDTMPDCEKSIAAQIYDPDAEHHIGLGTLQSVTMINFMCHSNFTITFGPFVNFVMGKNGSGKSAILTALVVCFGGRATTTGRGRSVKSFIKKGCQWGRVSVTIRNHSEGDTDYSYRHDDYGDDITIERNFRTNGTSDYVIRNVSGHIVDRSKKEVDSIVRHFSIQIDNPVVTLNQEVSRNFLNSHKAEDKYKFFMRGTNLEAHKENIKNLRKRLEWANDTKCEKNEILPEMKREVRGLEKRLEKLLSVKQYRDDKLKAEAELLWSYVQEKELILNQIQRELDKENNKLEDLKKDSQEYEQRLDRKREELEELKQKVLDQNEVVNKTTREVTETQKQVSIIEKEITELRTKQIQIQIKITDQEKIVHKTEEAIATEIRKAGNMDDIQKERDARRQKILSLEDEIRDCKTRLEDKERLMSGLQTWLDDKEPELRRLAGEKSSLQRQIQGINNRLNDMSNSRGDSRTVFGRHVPEVASLIDKALKEKKLSVRPIGPIGQYIKLKDASVSSALQSVMKALVRAYAVDNISDRKVLTDIFHSIGLSGPQIPQIITRKFSNRMFDVSYNKVEHSRVKSLLDYITVSDVNAFNVLIDKTGMETVAYIADIDDAESLLKDSRTVPTNCRKAYSKDATEFIPAAKNRGYAMYPNEYNNRLDVFSLDIAAQIEMLKSEKSKREEELERVVEAGRKLQLAVRNNTDQLNENQKEADGLRRNRAAKTRELERLKDFIEPAAVNVSDLQHELDETVEAKRKLESEAQRLERELTIKKKDLESAQSDLDENIEAKEDAENKLHLCLKRREKLATEIRNSEVSRSQRQLEAQTEKVNRIIAKKDAAVAEVEEKEKEAAALGRRPSNIRRPDLLKSKINSLAKVIEECENETGTEAEVKDRYEKAKANVEKIEQVLEVVSNCIQRCDQLLRKRRGFYYKKREEIEQNMRLQFESVLQSLGFEGTLEIQHEGKKRVNGEDVVQKARLSLRVNPKGKQSSHMYKDTRSLSGGERSFSTVAFLLALWEGCCSPFRILDEVDVFMDMVTRQVAMDALVTAARQKKRQYIFLSPLPLIQDHASHDDICIHKMPETEQSSQQPDPS